MQFIKQYPKIVPDEVCDRFIQFFEENEDQSWAGRCGLDYGKVDLAQKDSTDLDLAQFLYKKELVGWSESMVESLNTPMFKALCDYTTRMFCDQDGNIRPHDEAACRRLWIMTQPPRMMRYYPGQGFHGWHADRSKTNGREVVMMLYLNDVAEGGETAFFHQGVKIKPEKGKIALFPAGFTHHHCGMKVISNTKYCINFNFGYR